MADQLLDLTAFAPSSEPVLDLEQFAPPKPAPAKKPGILIPSVKRTAGQMVGAAGVALEDLGLKTRLPEVGEAIVEANPAQIQKPSDILEKPGTFLGESVSEMLPQLGAHAAGAWSGAKVGGRLGAFLGPKGAVAGAGIGGLVGGLAPIFTQEYGEIRETQKKEGAESIPKALLGATAATALERLGAEKLVGRIVKGGGMDLIKEGVSRPLHMLKQGAIGALVEGPLTEAPQTAIERLAGGAPLANEEAMADYIISSAKGAAGGGIVTGALSGLARREQPPMEAPPEVAPAAEVAPAGPAEPLGLAEFIRANRAPGTTGPLTAAEVKAARPDYEAYKQAFINEQFGVEALTLEQRNQILINQTPLEVPAPAVEPAPEAPTAFQRFPAAQAKIVVAPDQLQVEDISPTTRAVTQELRVSGPKLGVYMLEALDGEPVAGPFYSREEATRAALPRPAVASEKTGQAEPVVLGEQPAPAPAVPIITPQEAEFLRIAETETAEEPYGRADPAIIRKRAGIYYAAMDAAFNEGDKTRALELASRADALERQANEIEDTAKKRRDTRAALLKRQSGQLLTNREAKLVRDYEKAAPEVEAPAPGTKPKFRGRQFAPEQRRENFVDAYSTAVDSALADLVASGVTITPNKLKRAASLLKRSAEAAVAAKDDAAGATILDEEMGKALRGIIPKNEIETFRQKLADAAQAAMPETLNSRAAVDAAITSIEEFNANMPAFLRRPGWAIITGIQEKLGAFDTPANIAANAKLEAEMVARGLPFKKGPGKYLNVDQGDSFLVKMSEAEALDLAKRYGQQSVLTNEGYVYQNGSLTPVDHTKDTFGDEARKQDGYTEIDGKAFSLGLDFSQEIAKEDRVNPALPFAIHGIKAVHYSKTERSTLDGHRFGDGIKGAERERLRTADPRLRVRTSFYVSSGRGVFPEPGVGAVAHLSTLNNLYDADADPLHIWEGPSDANARELAVIEAGYAGYLARDTFDGQGAAVVFGRSDLPTKKVDAPNAVAEVPPAPKISEAQRARRAVAISKGYPAGAMPRSEWGDYVKRVNPEHYAALAPFGIFEGGEVVYRDGLLRGVQDPGVGRSRAAVDAAIIAKSDEIVNTLVGMIGTPKDLVVEVAPRVMGGAGMIQFGQLRDVITVSLQASDAGSVAAHEGYHYLEKRELTGPERRIVRQAFASGSRLHRMLVAKAEAYDAANGTDIASEIRAIPAEARAYGFEFWRRGELEAQGMIAKVFQKLARVMERIRNYIDGLGFTSYEDIFAMIRRGEYAKRDLSGIREFEREVMRSRAQREASEKAWYSALTEAVADIRKVAGKDGMIVPAQAKAWLAARQKEGRFKAAELEAVGLAEWLDLQQGKVSVDDIETFVREHGVQVEETMLGVAEPKALNVEVVEEDDQSGFPFVLRIDGVEENRMRTREAAEQEAEALRTDVETQALYRKNKRTTTKFSGYQLPGGENYRELLLRLPVNATIDIYERDPGKFVIRGMENQGTFTSEDRARRYFTESELLDVGQAFRSSHFDQPNILAHVRFNERTDADGKRVLFLEELQSDWAQKGRKEGFRYAGVQQRAKQLREAFNASDWAKTADEEGRDSVFILIDNWVAGVINGNLLARKLEEKGVPYDVVGRIHDMSSGTPTAPFVTETKAWVALALKRMIRYAAENGFDRVAWTTGEQQAARYDLSKQVDSLDYFVEDSGDWRLIGVKGGQQVIDRTVKDRKGLDELVGKEVAEKIVMGTGEAHKANGVAFKSLSGLDLKVGGEGMKAFYDRIVPQVANELLKKFGGGKVGEVQLAEVRAKQGNYVERGNGGYEVFYADGTSYGVYPTREGASVALAKIERTHPSPAPSAEPTTSQPGFDITPALRGEAMTGLPLFSKAATESIQDIGRRMSEGDLQREQVNAHLAAQLDRPDMRDMTERLAERAGFELSAIANSIRRGYHAFIGSGENRARASAGYRNVFNVMTHYMQRKSLIFERAIAKDLSTWVKGASRQDKVAVSKAMLAATVGSYSHDMPEYQALRNSLTTEQRAMMDQAWGMIGKMLDSEFEADARKYRKLFADDAKFEEWFANRKAQVDQLKKQSYFPERRYGDHFVHAYVEAPDGKKITMYYEQYEREAGATSAKAELEKIFGADGLKVEYGFKHKAEYDGSLSIGQFLDLAQRHGISLTQTEKERLGKALIAADSTRRNRVFRRQNVAGYSQDGMRVLAEFAVSMANKVAYSEMGDALQDALQGKQVDVAFTKEGTVTINTQEGTNVWEQDGPDAGFFRNLADEKVGFVMSPESRSTVSNKLRAMATVYFLGGSVAAAGINLSSLPMITLPWLTQHTNPVNASAKLLDGMRVAGKHFKEIRDLPTLLGSTPIEGVDEVDGLRHALQIAAQDGSLFDTEIYQFMGLSRGQEYSLSGRTQEAVKLWMTPFRIAEQYNRVSAFIAAYKVAKGNNLTNEAAFAQAQEAVYGTQFRYDEANRPALADSGVGSLFFVFKSFPIFMMETMTFLAKENPRSAVFMLGMLVLMAGVEGLPFAEDLEDLIDVIAQRLFGEPFNSKRWLRNTLKSASEAVVGADLSGVLMHGVANSLTGLNFASRVGAGNLVPGTRIGAADTDYRRAMEEILGPVGSMVSGVVAGGDALSKGDFMTAAKKGLPLAAKNAVKGWEQFEKGYATDAGGRKLVDVGSWEALWQSVGFSSSALAQVYESDSIDRRTSAFYTEIKGHFTKEMVKAIGEGDRAAANEVGMAVVAWNQAHPDMPIAMSPASVRRQVALAGMPLNQRTLLTMPKYLRGQSEAAIGLAAE